MATGELKADITNGAYSKMRISGITKIPGKEDNKLALEGLEEMAAEFFKKTICVGYNFEEEPDINSPSGIPKEFRNAFKYNLAYRLMDDFGKEPTNHFMRKLRGATQVLTSSSAPRRETQYPFRMPRGKSTRLRLGYGNRFNIPESKPPSDCSTHVLLVGEINDYVEQFEAYLLDEIISSFTIVAETGLTVLSSSNDNTTVSFKVRSDSNSQTGQYRAIVVTITTDTGRIKKRTVNFNAATFENN